MLDKIIKLIDHNRWIVIAAIIATLLFFWLCGCESQVSSIVEPSKTVTRAELQLEVENFVALAKIRFDRLDKDDELKELIVNNAFLIAQGGAINPLGVVTSMMSILGIGAVVDNRRKDKVIKDNLTKYVETVKNADTA